MERPCLVSVLTILATIVSPERYIDKDLFSDNFIVRFVKGDLLLFDLLSIVVFCGLVGQRCFMKDITMKV